MAAHLLPKQRAEGSNPFSRSNTKNPLVDQWVFVL